MFKATAKQKGIQVVAEEFTNDKATDFMTILTGIKSKKPDAIFFGGLDAQANSMLRQMKQLGLSNVKFSGGAAWKKKYDAKFPGPHQIYSPYAYDATFVLVDAMKRANSVGPKAYLPFIGKTQYKGVTASIAFNANGELTKPAVTLYTYKDHVRTALN